MGNFQSHGESPNIGETRLKTMEKPQVDSAVRPMPSGGSMPQGKQKHVKLVQKSTEKVNKSKENFIELV